MKKYCTFFKQSVIFVSHIICLFIYLFFCKMFAHLECEKTKLGDMFDSLCISKYRVINPNNSPYFDNYSM